MPKFREMSKPARDRIVQSTVAKIEQALAAIGVDPDGVLVAISDGDLVGVHFNGTDAAQQVMATVIGASMGRQHVREGRPHCHSKA